MSGAAPFGAYVPWGPARLSLGGQRTGGERGQLAGVFLVGCAMVQKPSLSLRCTRELPQTPAGAPAPRGAAGLHAKSGAAWAAWGRDQGPAPSETQHGYFRVHFLAPLPPMKTWIGCTNGTMGRDRRGAAQQHQLAWPRTPRESSLDVLFSKIHPSLTVYDAQMGSDEQPARGARGVCVATTLHGGTGDKGGTRARTGLGVHQKITRSSSSGGARPRCAASST